MSNGKLCNCCAKSQKDLILYAINLGLFCYIPSNFVLNYYVNHLLTFSSFMILPPQIDISYR